MELTETSKVEIKVYKLLSILADHSSKIHDLLLSPMNSFVTLMYFCDLFQFYEKIIFLFCQMCFIDKVDTPFSMKCRKWQKDNAVL